ncbi:MAG: hypothetical protein Hyperionvirus3_92 [Hyperionvirus sp.]|uniref:PNPLA domain-containing protein n=1 Tax=Hyperionvirus sp. TaxID=2487770 RepID=A0A3G5A6R3_9VIRU|nr:MAG: hypothetical protein Hyperionvirus3_92 [Hyperionvirus sp.]
MELNKETLKILSIDGGGIKGIYSLYVLKRIEEQLCGPGETLSDYFDMICGTSTGGIIALAISIRRPIKDIIEMYESNASTIFPNNENSYSLTKKLMGVYRSLAALWSYKYDNQALTKHIDAFFEKRTMKDANNLLCITSFQLETNNNRVFKYPFNDKMIRDGKILMRDAALATSAAPTYLPPHYIDELSGHFVDGGVWANDPSLVGITDALTDFIGNDKKYAKYDLLSIGNIVVRSESMKNMKSYWGGKNLLKLPTLFMDSNKNSTQHYCKSLCSKTDGRRTRIECNDFPYVDSLEMDNTTKEFITKLKGFGIRDGIKFLTEEAESYNIQRFFKAKKTWQP